MDAGIQKVEDGAAVCEAHLHLGRMHIDIQVFGRHGQMQDGEGKPVLHEVGPIPLLEAGGKLPAF